MPGEFGRGSTDGGMFTLKERPKTFETIQEEVRGLRPLGDTIWTLRDALDAQSAGEHGKPIQLSTGFSVPRRRGWVVAVGPDSQDLQIGEYVMFDRHFNRMDSEEDEFKIGEHRLVGIHREEVWAVVKKVMKKLVFEPLDDNVIVRRDPEQERSEGGIVIPDTAKQKATRGTVVAAGPGEYNWETKERRALQVAPGDRVLIGEYAGVDVEAEGGDRLAFVREREILAKLKE